MLVSQLIGFAGVLAVLALATLLAKGLHLRTETSRKLAHILLSHWILLAVVLFEGPLEASIAPACFIVINFISYKRGTFSAIEREENNSPGTVWFAVSLLVLCAVFFRLEMTYIAVCGMLAMGYGDGFAALVGARWGRRRVPPPFSDKSAAGCATVALLSALPVGVVCALAVPDAAPGFAAAAALSSGGIACALELVSPRGIDNLTLPLGVAATVWLCASGGVWPSLLLCVSLTLAVLVAAFSLGAISLPGAGAALLLGVALGIWGGWWAWAALIAFFVLGSAVSRAGKKARKKKSATALHKRSGARGPAQVAANGLPCLLFATGFALSGRPAALAASFGCLAAACADTFSSELGMLSGREPVSILTLRPVQRGISGGVSALGFLGAALGAAAVAALAVVPLGWAAALAVLVAGVAGSVADSLLGAAAQVKYRLPGGGLTERPELAGAALEQAAGVAWINNDVVNLLSGLIGGAVCLALSWTV